LIVFVARDGFEQHYSPLRLPVLGLKLNPGDQFSGMILTGGPKPETVELVATGA
jgi:hypothetical protein